MTGHKMWASMANETDVGVLLAKTDPDAGAKGVTAFIVEPKKYSGFEAQPTAISEPTTRSRFLSGLLSNCPSQLCNCQ